MREINFDAIPDYMKGRLQWVLWRLEPGADGKPTKVPYQPSGRKASSTNQGTWGSFTDVVAAYRRGGFSGIGYVLTGEFVAWDLDNCRDPETGQLEPWAEAIVKTVDSYTEVTPSGAGLRVIATGHLPDRAGNKRKSGNVEVFIRDFYITVTGWHLEGAPADIESRQEECLTVFEQYFPEKPQSAPLATPVHTPVDLEDAELINKARNNSTTGLWFRRLYDDGDISEYGDDPSRADYNLCRSLAFWTGRDAPRVDRLFRQSALYRDKWDEPRGQTTYGGLTITKAIARTHKVYDPNHNRNGIDWSTAEEDFWDEGWDEPDPPAAPQGFSYGYNVRLTDLGNARRLVIQHGIDLRFCHPENRWYVFNGRIWEPDETAAIHRRAKKTVGTIYKEASNVDDEDDRKAIAKHAVRSEGVSRLQAMITLASSEPGIPILREQLNTDPWLLSVNNGTLDLRTGELKAHRREDYITKMVPIQYDPAAPSPVFKQALLDIMKGRQPLVDYLQRVAGYSLTGDVSAKALFIFHGSGDNGKSLLLELLAELLGPFAVTAEPDLLMSRRNEAHPTGVAKLWGARLVIASETTENRSFNEALVKQLTGGDTLTGRFMRQDFFDFKPTHKLFLATNHRPVIRGTDPAIWERIHLIPFDETFHKPETGLEPAADPRLLDKLRAELPGILAWAVQGCLKWQRDGLKPPAEVKAATGAYRDEMDILAQFFNDVCVLEPNAWARATDLYQAYKNWCTANGERWVSQRRFGGSMTERGYARQRGAGGVIVYHGVGVVKDFSEYVEAS